MLVNPANPIYGDKPGSKIGLIDYSYNKLLQIKQYVMLLNIPPK